MAAVKRTKIQRERDRAEIARRYLRGETQAAIAEALGLTQQMISYDLKIIQRRWMAESIRSFNELKARELAKIDELERQYWEAWTASTRTKETTETEKATTTDDGTQMRARMKKQDVDGDPRFLAGVQWCIDRRCQLLGLDAPKKIAPTNLDGDKLYDPFSGIKDILISRLDRLAAVVAAESIPGEPER